MRSSSFPPEDIPTLGKAASTAAGLPSEKLLEFYRLMNTSRKWENTLKDLFLSGADGLYGAFHTYVGEEAIAVGAMGALNEDDYIASTHRGHGHLIAKGGDINRMSAEIFFKESGYNKSYGGSMHITDMAKGIMGMNGIVGASFYMAAGAALRSMVRGTKQVAVAFYGDGAAASPYYFSAVRSCKRLNIPVIFVAENNFQYMSIPVADSVATKYVVDYTKGLDIPHHLVDGNDVTAMYSATAQAVEWARAGNGPSVIEGLTYRWYDHSGFAGTRVGQDGAFSLPYPDGRRSPRLDDTRSHPEIQALADRQELSGRGGTQRHRIGSAGRGRRLNRVRPRGRGSRAGGGSPAHPRRWTRSRKPVLQPQRHRRYVGQRRIDNG